MSTPSSSQDDTSRRRLTSGLLELPLAKIVFGVVLLIVGTFAVTNSWQNLDASHIMVVQSPFDGTLTWHTAPGVKWQGFGKVTTYKKRHQFEFECSKAEDGKESAGGIITTFNDGGKGSICGSIAWEMPLDTSNLNLLHTKYGSDDAIEGQIIRAAVEKSITMTGPLVSSTESYSARRNELLSLVLDQISHGVYRTTVREEKAKDEMTATEKTIKVVNLVPSTNVADHGWARQEPSPLDEFRLHAFNLTIKDVVYDPAVVAQIKAQQASIMQVQTAMADAKRAEQAAITAAKNGEAEAAKAKWEQEVIKAKEVTEAQQRRDVAALDLQTAELTRKRLIAEGEGEASKRRLIMQADGALEKKLAAWVDVTKAGYDAIAKYQGQWVPSVVMGGSGASGSGNVASVADVVNQLAIKNAYDLGLEVSRRGGIRQAGEPKP